MGTVGHEKSDGDVDTNSYPESRRDSCYDDNSDGSKISDCKSRGNKQDRSGGRIDDVNAEGNMGSFEDGYDNHNGKRLKTDIDVESYIRKSIDRNGNGTKTDDDRDRDDCVDNKDDINGNGIDRIGHQNDDRNSFSDQSCDDGDGLKIDGNRYSDDDDACGIHSGGRAISDTEDRVDENDVTNGGGSEDEDVKVNGYSAGDDAVQGRDSVWPAHLLFQDQEETHEEYDSEISPAFGILSIYCNSEIHYVI